MSPKQLVQTMDRMIFHFMIRHQMMKFRTRYVIPKKFLLNLL